MSKSIGSMNVKSPVIVSAYPILWGQVFLSPRLDFRILERCGAGSASPMVEHHSTTSRIRPATCVKVEKVSKDHTKLVTRDCEKDVSADQKRGKKKASGKKKTHFGVAASTGYATVPWWCQGRVLQPLYSALYSAMQTVENVGQEEKENTAESVNSSTKNKRCSLKNQSLIRSHVD